MLSGHFEKYRENLQTRFDAKKATMLLAFFYFVGILGLSFSYTYELYTALTPFALLLSVFILIIYHQPNFSLKQLIAFGLIFLAGFFVEVIGVSTGLIFGEYTYSAGLGPKILNTPLMIGVNWLMLSYIVYDVLQSIPQRFVRLLAGATLLLVYDILLEQLAAYLDMWFWADHVIPMQNYVAWFAIGFAFQAILMLSNIKLENKLSLPVLSVQFIFFALLLILQLL